MYMSAESHSLALRTDYYYKRYQEWTKEKTFRMFVLSHLRNHRSLSDFLHNNF